MSDKFDEITFHGEQLLRKTRTDSLRGQMRAFISNVEDFDLKDRRSSVSRGEQLSNIVTADRDERL
ncbi:hypothetical protein Huta_2888 [Halorhabdus utahensis DSM 12940]|uniref:Uncharacterized protein n=1 Tax=Halorhabdus utahensis (strain DSM 12940 / JCM 11049 / AX-2) TaxID=519442 RepID=C7NRU4_HALUD|nr:hypothetical protein [Halorhabdus utahensis]ACV13049.1 hypothetical protein Huta_2888 [Halorhabdus utahensis DSM 12940]